MGLKTTKSPNIDWKTVEDEAVLRASIKKPSLFELLVNRYQDKFYKTAFGVVRHREIAEDIVQESFTKIYFKANSFRKIPGAGFKSWAYKIVLNTAFVHYRKIKRQRSLSVELEPKTYDILPDPRAEDFKTDTELKDFVSGVMKQMPRHLQKVLNMYYLDGESYKNIAKKENTTISTIKMRIFRARKLFKKILFLSNNDEGLYRRQEVKIY